MWIGDLSAEVESHPFLFFHNLRMARKETGGKKKKPSNTQGLISIALLLQKVKQQLCEM